MTEQTELQKAKEATLKIVREDLRDLGEKAIDLDARREGYSKKLLETVFELGAVFEEVSVKYGKNVFTAFCKEYGFSERHGFRYRRVLALRNISPLASLSLNHMLQAVAMMEKGNLKINEKTKALEFSDGTVVQQDDTLSGQMFMNILGAINVEKVGRRKAERQFNALEKNHDLEIKNLKQKCERLSEANRQLKQGQMNFDVVEADKSVTGVVEELESFIMKVFTLDELNDADQVRVNNWLDRLGILVSKGREKVGRLALMEIAPDGEDFDLDASLARTAPENGNGKAEVSG